MQVASHTLTCRVERGGPVLVTFFANLGLGEAAPREMAVGSTVRVASLLRIAGTKAAVVQQRAQPRDYLDIDALIRHGIGLPRVLAAGAIVYGRSFNPPITLKCARLFRRRPGIIGRGTAMAEGGGRGRRPDPSAGVDATSRARQRQWPRAVKELPKTPELLRVARRVIWFEEPERALADPLAHVMVFGTPEDLQAVRGIVGND